MKKLLIVFAALTLTAGAFGQTIVGSAHDFSGSGWGGGEICIACHTPHNADTTVSDAPLWNHEVTSATFTIYSSPTLDATIAQPAGVSKLCLSCHDGTVALDNFGGTNTGTNFISTGLVGIDLKNDHPISITYDSALATTDGELVNPALAGTGPFGGSISADMLFGAAGDQLECASCHDVHRKYTYPSLLLVDNANSTLCLTCHDK